MSDDDVEQPSGTGAETGTDTDPTRSESIEATSSGTELDQAAAENTAAASDELPEDLQPHLVDPEDYVFPNNNRRRVPGYLYLIVAVGLCLIVLFQSDSAFVNGGFIGAAALLGAFGLYSIVSGWNLDVDERDALVAAVDEVGFPVGHASAQMGWRGLLSRPTWRILLYSADEPPTRRGFVLVDGVDASIVTAMVEDNPEDWTEHYASGELS